MSNQNMPAAIVKDQQALDIMQALEAGGIEWRVEFDSEKHLVAKVSAA